jgi:hypothetical protein
MARADRVEYTNRVPNYTGGEALTLEVGSRDGQVFVRLVRGVNYTLHCVLEPDEAERVARALGEAARQMKAGAG